MTCVSFHFRRRLGRALLLAVSLAAASRAAESTVGGAAGAVSGRIVNEVSGAALERARVTLEGTLLEAFPTPRAATCFPRCRRGR